MPENGSKTEGSHTHSVTCFACGAPVRELSRRCDYCGAPVATVRCGACYQMNHADAIHCAGCGRALGLEPIPEMGQFACSRCTYPLAAFGAPSGRLLDCARCGGQFVEYALLRELLERTVVVGSAVPRRPVAPPPGGKVDTVLYVPCPVCTSLMNRRNFGGTSGVIVDHCGKHGIWFDEGELPRVLEFVEGGGLARPLHLAPASRPHATLDGAKIPMTESAEARAFGGMTAFHSQPAAWETGLWENAKAAAFELLEHVREWLEQNRHR